MLPKCSHYFWLCRQRGLLQIAASPPYHRLFVDLLAATQSYYPKFGNRRVPLAGLPDFEDLFSLALFSQ